MIVYTATKQQFVDDVRANAIADIIEGEVARKLNRNSPKKRIHLVAKLTAVVISSICFSNAVL